MLQRRLQLMGPCSRSGARKKARRGAGPEMATCGMRANTGGSRVEQGLPERSLDLLVLISLSLSLSMSLSRLSRSLFSARPSLLPSHRLCLCQFLCPSLKLYICLSLSLHLHLQISTISTTLLCFFVRRAQSYSARICSCPSHSLPSPPPSLSLI